MGRIKGMNSVRKELRQLKKKARVATDRGAMKVAQVIRDEARANAPEDMGNIKRSLEVEKRGDYAVVFADPTVAPHAPYLEFGTGDFAVAPAPEYAEYMREFYVNGEGKTPPKPYLFPAFFRHRDKVIPTIEEEFKKL